MRFIRQAVEKEHCFESDLKLESEMAEITSWLAERSAEQASCTAFGGPAVRVAYCLDLQVDDYRIKMIEKIESLGRKFRKQGYCEPWFADADPKIREVRKFSQMCLVSACAQHRCGARPLRK